MVENELNAEIRETTVPLSSEFRRFSRVFLSRGLVVSGLIVILIFVLTAIFAPLLAPCDPNSQDYLNVFSQPSSAHLLGTDFLGRDTLSRLIYGARSSLMVGIVALCIAAIVGMTFGLIAGYFGGIVNTIIMRIIDAMMAFPMILLALIIAALLGGGLKNVMIAIGVALIPIYARMMCGMVLSIKENDFIMAARAIGGSNFRIMLRHIVPNCLSPLIVVGTMQIGTSILAEAGLSYLGIGITPPTPAWGAMVSDGRNYLMKDPLVSFVPGVAIMLVVFAFNIVGDGLRDALDPKIRSTM